MSDYSANNYSWMLRGRINDVVEAVDENVLLIRNICGRDTIYDIVMVQGAKC